MISNQEWDRASPDGKLGLLRRELEAVVPTIGELWSKVSAQNRQTLTAVGGLAGQVKDLIQKLEEK
jgi:hypothetical protein